MPRPRKKTSSITKWRLDRGWHTPQLAAKAELSRSTIDRIENGMETSRPLVAKYLRALEFDLTDPATLPKGWEILDREEKVILQSGS